MRHLAWFLASLAALAGCASSAPQSGSQSCVTHGACVPCLPANDNCAAGKYCLEKSGAFQCASGCKSEKECAADGGTAACCDHACLDVSSDNQNCGGCGMACMNGMRCCGGRCAD